MSTAPLLEVRELSTSVNGAVLLDIERFALDESASVLLTGANGAGKTTLLRILSGLLRPDAASFRVDGLAGSWRAVRDRLVEIAVYFHQDPYIFDRTVRSNIAYGLRCRKRPAEEIEERVGEALEWAGLEHAADRNARKLSGGERQRLALARARVLRPRLLFLDEPTVGLDRSARERTLSLIRRLAADPMALVISSHEPESLAEMAETHLHLEDGRLVAVRRTGEREQQCGAPAP